MKPLKLTGKFHKLGPSRNPFSNGKQIMVERYDFHMIIGTKKALMEWLGETCIYNSSWPKQTSMCLIINGSCWTCQREVTGTKSYPIQGIFQLLQRIKRISWCGDRFQQKIYPFAWDIICYKPVNRSFLRAAQHGLSHRCKTQILYMVNCKTKVPMNKLKE